MLPLLMISRSRQGSGFYHFIKNNSSTPLYNFFSYKIIAQGFLMVDIYRAEDGYLRRLQYESK